jgi:hypothetical protein
MLSIQGVSDGKTFKILPTELVPAVHGEVPVAIIFLEDVSARREALQHLAEVARGCVRRSMPCRHWA